ncbi:MAG TPA: DUF4397 domain-containing protein [Phototrophicaceae bacterium]|nr:DUF4397 domain-containing protein [Phototrophicaceae bacterium]
MRKTVSSVILAVLMALCASALVSAQAVTVTVEPPSGTVTVTPPVQPTIEVTSEVTASATAETTAQATAAPTAQVTAQATAAVTPAVATTPTDQSAYLRFAHFSPDAPAIDVYVNGTLAVKNLTYPSISEWIAFDPGSESISVTATGDSTGSTVFAPTSVSASAGTWQTVAVVGSASSKTLQAAVVTEDYGQLLPSTGGFTFLNAVVGSDPVNLVKANVTYFAQVGAPGSNTSASSTLRGDSGTFDVSAVDPKNPSTVFASQTSFDIPENAYTFLALIGTPGNEKFFSMVTDMSAVEIVRGLLPKPGTLIDALNADPNLTAFAAALQSAGLADMLNDSSTQYTIFAPANFILDNTQTVDQQAAALKAYIVQGKYTSKQLLSTGTLTALDGSTLKFTTNNNAIFVNSAQIIDLNIAATNGVIHMLNGHLP